MPGKSILGAMEAVVDEIGKLGKTHSPHDTGEAGRMAMGWQSTNACKHLPLVCFANLANLFRN
ncbi:MAG: hypothetical protein LBC30_02360 [Puniceicoccales bacterium]|nr:hypothetical protein [Puniceicoccales bacterium]